MTAAVSQLRRELCAPTKKTAHHCTPQERIQDLEERARLVVADFEALSDTDRHSADWPIFCAALTWACSALRRIETQTEL